MDVFVFASRSETQGMVLTEAMAAGKPVVALDAPGVREVVADRRNGRLLTLDRLEDFAAALDEIGAAPMAWRKELEQAARETAERFSMYRCGRGLLSIYRHLLRQQPRWTERRERVASRHGGNQGGMGIAQEHGGSGRSRRKTVNTKHECRNPKQTRKLKSEIQNEACSGAGSVAANG